jgi:hypothetical protein
VYEIWLTIRPQKCKKSTSPCGAELEPKEQSGIRRVVLDPENLARSAKEMKNVFVRRTEFSASSEWRIVSKCCEHKNS